MPRQPLRSVPFARRAETSESLSSPGYVDVRDFGADGSDGQPDTANVQAAIKALVEHGAGTVWFPAGSYDIATITLPPTLRGLTFKGIGRNDLSQGSVLVHADSGPMITSTGSIISFTIEDLALQQSGPNAGHLIQPAIGGSVGFLDIHRVYFSLSNTAGSS